MHPDTTVQNKIKTRYTELPFIEPWQLYMVFRDRGSILLESPAGPEKTARYSFVLFEPVAEFVVKDGFFTCRGLLNRQFQTPRPLRELRDIMGAFAQEPVQGLGPFQGGLAGLFSYDFVHYIERLPRTAVDDLSIPDAHLYLYDRLFLIDHSKKKTFAILCEGLREGSDKYLSEMERAFKEAQMIETDYTIPPVKRDIDINHDMGKDQYMRIVQRAKEYIRAGDIFQANLSQRFWTEFDINRAWQLYLVLRRINPSPFAFFADMGGYCLV
ncbi:MAG: hypothetical protein D6778_08435, partial [Nitrospirae bacterium]